MCAKYQHIFLQPIFEYTKDKSPEVRQAAVYGCGILAQVYIFLFHVDDFLLVYNSPRYEYL